MQPACLLLEASTYTCKTDMQFALVNSDHCTIAKIQNQFDILFLFTMQDRHAVCPTVETECCQTKKSTRSPQAYIEQQSEIISGLWEEQIEQWLTNSLIQNRTNVFYTQNIYRLCNWDKHQGSLQDNTRVIVAFCCCAVKPFDARSILSWQTWLQSSELCFQKKK